MLVKLAPYLPNVTSTEILDNLKKLIKTFLLCLLELFIFIDFLKSGVSKCVSCFYFFLRCLVACQNSATATTAWHSQTSAYM